VANRFSTWLKKRVVRKDQNLVSLEDPYQVMHRLLQGVPVRTIVDAGASDGHISRRLARLFPSAGVYGFEPHPMYRRGLEALAQSEPRFSPEFDALSDHEGRQVLHITASPGNTSLLAPNEQLEGISPEGHHIIESLEVSVTTLEAWAHRRGVESVDIMKFDIQGGELAALRGAGDLLNTVRAIYSEIWFNMPYEDGASWAEIDLLLRSFGLILHDIYKPKYGPGGVLTWANALWVRPASWPTS